MYLYSHALVYFFVFQPWLMFGLMVTPDQMELMFRDIGGLRQIAVTTTIGASKETLILIQANKGI